jgi:hypothetical protein
MNMIPEDDLPPALRARMASLSAAVSTLQPPPALEAALHARMFAADAHAARPAPAAAMRPARRQPSLTERWAAWCAWPVSVAAAMGLCSWMVLTNPAVAPERTEAHAAAGAGSAGRPAGGTATPFLALAAFEDFPAGVRSEVVAATLPRATLAEFGLPVSPMRAAELIDAEFLVGPNGSVLAVRFVDDAGR